MNKRWGDYDTKFANVRNLYAYRFAHPGKKLNFRSNDLASFDEWKETEVIPWNVLDYPKHKGLHELFKDLNRIYRTHPARYFQEYNPVHFNWIMADNSEQSVYVFERETKKNAGSSFSTGLRTSIGIMILVFLMREGMKKSLTRITLSMVDGTSSMELLLGPMGKENITNLIRSQ